MQQINMYICIMYVFTYMYSVILLCLFFLTQSSSCFKTNKASDKARHWLLSGARRSRLPHVQLLSFISFSLSSSMFLSVCVSFYSHQGSTWGQLMVVLLVACASHNQSSSIFDVHTAWLVLFLLFCATHSLRLSGTSIYA